MYSVMDFQGLLMYNRYKCNFYRICSGLRIYCAVRDKTYMSQSKPPSPKAILMGLRHLTVNVLNSYILSLKEAAA